MRIGTRVTLGFAVALGALAATLITLGLSGQTLQKQAALATQARALADSLALEVHNPPACHQLDLHGMTVMAAVSQVRAQLQALQHLAQVGSLWLCCHALEPTFAQRV